MMWQRFKNSFQTKEDLRDYIVMCVATFTAIFTVIFGIIALLVFL